MSERDARRSWSWPGILAGGLACAWLTAKLAQRLRLERANRLARVLVVGDERLVLAHYGRLLARAGYQVSALDPETSAAAVPPGSDWDLVLVCASDRWLPEALGRLTGLALSGPQLVLQDRADNLPFLSQALGDQPAYLLGTPRSPTIHLTSLGAAGELVLGEADGARSMRLGLAAALLRRAGWKVNRRRTPWAVDAGPSAVEDQG